MLTTECLDKLEPVCPPSADYASLLEPICWRGSARIDAILVTLCGCKAGRDALQDLEQAPVDMLYGDQDDSWTTVQTEEEKTSAVDFRLSSWAVVASVDQTPPE